jgi:Uma2 family endonuclease
MLIVEGHRINIKKNPDHLTNDEFFEFCQMNKELRIERDANLNIIIMSPVGGHSGYYEKEFMFEIELWIRNNNNGRSFSSSTGFLMPNDAIRSPDACWVSEERWAKVSEEEKKKFPPVVPDFIVEIRSSSDALKTVKNKMEEWIANGVRLAWLIDIRNYQSYIFRADGSIELIEGFDKQLSGEDVMNGFVFNLANLKMP